VNPSLEYDKQGEEKRRDLQGEVLGNIQLCLLDEYLAVNNLEEIFYLPIRKRVK
jgi:hypothetical protein